jgi:hypothetical protein
MQESVYDVSFWLAWPFEFPEYVGWVPAFDPLQAVLLPMEEAHLARVAKAAVRLPDGHIERWYGVRLAMASAECRK